MGKNANKSVKKVAKIVIAVVVVVFVLLWARFNLLGNAEQYRYEVERLVSEATGYNLTVNGEMKLRWPGLAIVMTDMRLQNPPDFADLQPDFLVVPKIKASLKFWPALAGRYVVKNITFEDMTLNLLYNRYGRANWNFGIVTDANRGIFGDAADNMKARVGGLILSMPFEVFKVENGSINYTDARPGGGSYKLAEADVVVWPFNSAQSRLNFEFKAKMNNLPLRVKGYLVAPLGDIFASDWPYGVELYFIERKFGL